MDYFQVLLEAFAGKDKRFKECEAALGEIRAGLVKERNSGVIIHDKYTIYTNSPSNQKLCKTLEEIFKIKEINIYWINGDGLPNAYTLVPMFFNRPSSNFHERMMVRDNTLNIKVHIYVYQECITYSDCNERELLALILHELGHNLYLSIPQLILQTIGTIMFLPQNIINMIGLMAKPHLQIFLQKTFPVFYSIVISFKKFASIPYTIPFVNALLATLSVIDPRKLHNLPIRIFGSFMSYGDEKGADSLAAKYGYGPDLILALKKIQDPEYSVTNKIKTSAPAPLQTVMCGIDEFSECMMTFLLRVLLDPHPSNSVRCHAMLNKLENDLKTGDYPPGYKKELQDQIAEMRRLEKEVNSSTNENSPQIKKAICNSIDALFGGHADFREIAKPYHDTTRF